MNKPNTYQDKMLEHLGHSAAMLAQAQVKVHAGDIHGEQARVVFAQKAIAEFFEESIACPKSEAGYAR